ncbi:MAG TPA: PepSY domain-containing protein [Burkholderiales bacterium]|nr:PepSY domain-containing protein [Burkholderiales bacterium]
MRTLFGAALSGTLLGLCGPVFAQSSTDDALNGCLQAAKQQHQGIVTGWTVEHGAAGPGFEISMVGPQDRSWKLDCRNGTLAGVEGRLGGRDYQMLSSRKSVPEASARATAATAITYSKMQKMAYSLTWLGRPYYRYYFTTEDGRTAQVDVNAETGKIDRMSSERLSSWW